MDSLDFIAISERMEESLVVLQLLLGLDPMDVMVMPSKIAGGFEDFKYNRSSRGCQATKKPIDIPEAHSYLQHNYTHSNIDYLIYAAANRSLDRTIEWIGKDVVEEQLQIHRTLQQLLVKECTDETYFPCSPEGVYQPEKHFQNCYERDSGCGYPCVDRVLETYVLANQ